MIRQTSILAFLLCVPCTGYAQTEKSSVIAFLHANVVPMDKEQVLTDQTVVVRDGKIVNLGATGSVTVPKSAVRIDAHGRYLMPALADMHVHLLGEAWNMMLPPEQRRPAKDIAQDRLLFPYVAEGVTMVQALSATPEEITLRRRINQGELLGPRLVLAPMIDGPKKAWPPPISTWVNSPDEAREAVRHAKADGYDKIKVYSFLTKDEYDAIIAESKAQNIGVIGHVPMALSVEYVIDSGQQLIAHTEELAKHANGDYSTQRIEHYADLMAKNGTWLIPTLVTTRCILGVFDNLNGLLTIPESKYFREPLEQGVWTFIANNLYKPLPADLQNKIRDDFMRFQRPLTTAYYKRGGRMLAGSDAPLPGLVPGFALHHELQELVDVGFTPFDALRTATSAPFEYLGESAQRGTIAVGKDTDLLLVDANPLVDVAAAGKISGVLMRGRWLSGQEIQRRLQALTN